MGTDAERKVMLKAGQCERGHTLRSVTDSPKRGYCDAFHAHCLVCNLTKTQHDARASLPEGDPDRCTAKWTRIPKGANLWECRKCGYWACSDCYKKCRPRNPHAKAQALRKCLAIRKKARRAGKVTPPKRTMTQRHAKKPSKKGYQGMWSLLDQGDDS